MDIHYPTAETPASPEYVLSVIRDMHRQQAQFDGEVDGEAILTFGTTVADWREACDLVGWRQLGQALNSIWGVEASSAQWKAVLEPEYDKRLSDVCEFLSQRVSRPQIRAACLLGRPCATAGAFLTVRSLLHEAGAGMPAISRLRHCYRRTPGATATFSSRGSRSWLQEHCPPVRIATPVNDAVFWGFPVGALVLIAAACAGSPLLGIAGWTVLGLAYALDWIVAFWLLPSSVEFGSLRTFRDLAVRAIASRRRGPDSLEGATRRGSWASSRSVERTQ